MFDDKETCCFMQLLKRFLNDDDNYLLSVKNFENIKSNKRLLGYYDKEYIYIIPSVVIGMCDTILIQNKLKQFNMQKVLKHLFALNYIKVHWVLTNEVRYRPQKRIGKTRKRYITFYKKPLLKFIMREGYESES